MHKVTKFGESHVKFALHSCEIRTNFVRANVLGSCVNIEVSVKLVRNSISYEFHTNLSEFILFFLFYRFFA